MPFAPWAGLTGAGGTPAYQFLPESYGAKGDVQLGVCSVINGSGVVTLTQGTVSSADVGKNITICGATGAAPAGPLTDTIASVNTGANTWTLATQTAGLTIAGLSVVWSTDDRLAVDSCVQAAGTYMFAHEYYAQVICNSMYGLGTGLFQSTSPVTYNTQLRGPYPNVNGSTQKLEFQLLGPGSDNAHQQFWLSDIPNLLPGAFVSYSAGPTTADPTFGQQSVIGWPTGGAGTGANGFFNVKPVIRGIQTWQPGWSNSIGMNLSNVGGCRIYSAGCFGFAPASSLGSGVNPYNGWPGNTFWRGKIAVGITPPGGQNNQDTLIESFAVGGLNTGVVTNADGMIFHRLITVSNDVPVKILGGTNYHDLIIERIYFENCNAGINTTGSPGSDLIAVYITMDGENSSLLGSDVNDANNLLGGVIHWSDLNRAAPTITGAASVQIINDRASPGHMSTPPTVPATTVASTPVYRPARAVVVHTGAGVTVSAIAVNGTSLSQTVAASSSSAPFGVPSGGTVTLTYAGGTPTWDWWLD